MFNWHTYGLFYDKKGFLLTYFKIAVRVIRKFVKRIFVFCFLISNVVYMGQG